MANITGERQTTPTLYKCQLTFSSLKRKVRMQHGGRGKTPQVIKSYFIARHSHLLISRMSRR